MQALTMWIYRVYSAVFVYKAGAHTPFTSDVNGTAWSIHHNFVPQISHPYIKSGYGYGFQPSTCFMQKEVAWHPHVQAICTSHTMQHSPCRQQLPPPTKTGQHQNCDQDIHAYSSCTATAFPCTVYCSCHAQGRKFPTCEMPPST
jgi:hypothetical protein